jgi:transposase
MDLKAYLQGICGVDLTTIEGIDVMTAMWVVSEIGADVSAFKTEDHFASWLGLTPSKDISGGKVIGRAFRKVQNRLAGALRMAASTLLYSNSYLGARYRHLRKELPTKAAAIKAMARYLAVLIYRMLTKGEAWVDRGAAKFEQKRNDLEMASLSSRALAKGFKLTPISAIAEAN